VNASIATLVIDDEPLAREGLARMVSELPHAHVVGIASSARHAIAQIPVLKPDVLLLDIEMPGHDGFAVLHALPPEHRPFVVFITAHEQYAIPAIGVDALDYILKPVSARRLNEAFVRVGSAMERRKLERLGRTVRSLASEGAPHATLPAIQSNLVIRDAGRMRVVPLDSVECIAADGYNVLIRVATRQYLLRESLDSLAKRLPAAFVRVHRSAIVHLTHVRELRTRRGHGGVVVLRSGYEVPVSRRQIATVRETISRHV
jgi:two-component system LytT family response regulator